jgi:predicted RNase H-like nuclease (RuvC/YqgF family)
MTNNVDNIQMLPLSFPDIMTKLYLTWESSEKEKQELQDKVSKYKINIDEITAAHTELLKNVERLQNINIQYEKEISELQKKLDDVEDDQKQFRKVSHILTMDRENSNYKQQIAILERRVAFYQNQCNNIKSSKDVTKVDEQTDTDDLLVDDSVNPSTNHINITDSINSDNVEKHNLENNITYNDDINTNNNEDGINVKEKKIKGVIYYLSDNGDIYIKNDDNSIGELKGKIESLPSGKTKVKWYKSS